MRIGLSSSVAATSCASSDGSLSVGEFLARFPEVPGDLAGEAILAEYVAAFGPLLRLAQKPSPCMGTNGDAPQQFYTKLVNDLAIYGIGLAKRDRTLARLQATLDAYRKQPATFGCGLVPRRAPDAPRVGCGV
jgi:hypothetical protein